MALTALSFVWQAYWIGGSSVVGFGSASLAVDWETNPFAPPGFGFDRVQPWDDVRWTAALVPWWYLKSPPYMLIIPVWPLVPVVLVVTAVRLRRDLRIPPGHCQRCGYDLTGNVSGRCPECGTGTEVTEDDGRVRQRR